MFMSLVDQGNSRGKTDTEADKLASCLKLLRPVHVDYGQSVYFTKEQLSSIREDANFSRFPCGSHANGGRYVNNGATPGLRHYNAQRRIRECFEYVRDVYEPQSGISHDYFVKTRPDVVFTQPAPFIEVFRPGNIYWSVWLRIGTWSSLLP